MTLAPNSIKRDLLVRLAGPLLALTVFAGASAYGLSSYVASVVLDQWLYDSAISLAKRVHKVDGRVTVVIGEQGREILEWDAVDKVFYEVTTQTGELLAANAQIPNPPKAMSAGQERVYYDGIIEDAAARIVAVPVSHDSEENVLVKMAETRNKKSALTKQALWTSIAVSILIAVLSGLFTWHGISSGIASMERAVRAAGEQHSQAPLQPIPIREDMPSEVTPLVVEINRLIENLGVAYRLNQRFISDAAHQLRTPLATLRVQLDMARRERDPQRPGGALDDAVNGLVRMSRVVHQLLTLTKAEHADVQAAASVDLDQIARQAIERHLDTAMMRGIDLGYVGPVHPVLIFGRVDLLSEAVSNLIENALQYGARGLKVTVGVIPSPPEIYVEDRGLGIPQVELSRVRDRFYRIPGSAGDGCGLGLSIVDEISRQSDALLILEAGPDSLGLRARLIFSEPARSVADQHNNRAEVV